MNHIDFKTSHFIVLSYPLASLGHRIGAFLIDLFISYLAFVLISFFFSSETMTYIMYAVTFLCYHLCMEIANRGQSIGKKVLKIRVVNLEGNTPDLRSYVIRWAFRIFDIGISLGFVAMATIYASKKGQRIGDLLAGTTVVREEHHNTAQLIDLETLQDQKANAVYSKFDLLSDEQMLLVKQMLQRYRRFPTPENGKVLIELANKISELVDDRGSQHQASEFLESVLRDYILHTR